MQCTRRNRVKFSIERKGAKIISTKNVSDFYDRPSNNRSVKSGLNKLGYCYADDVNNPPIDEGGACDEHIYDEIKYSNYCETTRR